jgi:hypothetical protein
MLHFCRAAEGGKPTGSDDRWWVLMAPVIRRRGGETKWKRRGDEGDVAPVGFFAPKGGAGCEPAARDGVASLERLCWL